MRSLTAPVLTPPPCRENTFTHGVVFEEDRRCDLAYRSDSDIDYLPVYLSHLKLCRAARRPQHQP